MFFSLCYKVKSLKFLLQMARNERFSEEYQSEVRSVVEVVTTHIIQRFKDNPVEARAANTALAHFLKVRYTALQILGLQCAVEIFVFDLFIYLFIYILQSVG